MSAVQRTFAERLSPSLPHPTGPHDQPPACADVAHAVLHPRSSEGPLLASSVSNVKGTTRGFLMTLKPDVDAQQTYQRLACHLAYAVASGFDRPSCPLFLKGTSLSRVGADGISFVGDTEVVALDLRYSARRIFTGYQPVTSP